MKKIMAFVFICFFTLVNINYLHSSSTGKTGVTNEGCTCHGKPSDGNSIIALTASPDIFTTGYNSATTYLLTITVTGGPSTSIGGFNLKVSAGVLSNPGANAKLQSGEATHSNKNSRSWTVDWTSPNISTGVVQFYFTGNAVNGNGNNTGDDPTVPQLLVANSNNTGIQTDQTPKAIKDFTVFQNFPNPFNPETRIAYQIIHAGNVELTIFDMLGAVIFSTSEFHTVGGNYNFNWGAKTIAGEKVPSGVYIYQLKNEQLVIRKKMTLIR
jgi:hypothetical protein